MVEILGNKRRLILLVIMFILPTMILAQDARPLMRYPDITDDLIVFVYGRDIWTVPSAGGIASRLTLHEGHEYTPKFSPDGSLIAFTAAYDGNNDVYVMDRYGGNIKRLTYHPSSDIVIGWNTAKNKIIFNSSRKSGLEYKHLFMISPDGSGLEDIPVFECAFGSFSVDGKSIAFNKVDRLDRTWKRYYGGTATDVYLYNFETQEQLQLTDYKGEDHLPMWLDNKVYFNSDRDGVLNIYAYDLHTNLIEQITRHSDYDVQRPSAGGSKIIYELCGTLWVLDTQTGQTNKVDVQIKADAPEVRPYVRDVSDMITNIELSPTGQRALLVARGELFTVPAEHGQTRNLSNNCGSREKDAVWSPDGTKVAYLSDVSGEYEIYIVDPKADSAPFKLTTHQSGYRHSLKWSPDSKKLAYADETLRCFYIDITTKKIIEIDKADYEHMDVAQDVKPISDYSWSPDSRYLAYSKMGSDLLYKIYIYALEENRIYQISNDLFNDFNPAFTLDGQHLVFISNRRFEPVFCDFEWEMVYKKIAGIYCLTLQKDGEALFPYRHDEENSGDSTITEKKSSDKSGKVKSNKTVIDFKGLYQRIEAFPVDNGNYRNLSVNDNRVFYLNSEEGDYNRFEFRDLGPRTLHAFLLEDREESTMIEGITDYKLSPSGNKIIYQSGNTIGIVDASASNASGQKLDLSDVTMKIDPIREWTQIFNDVWRLERDYYYDPGMHGLDWPAMKEKYGSLVKYASCRQDLEYLIGELIGELSSSHTYVYAGDNRKTAEYISVGLLGADYEVDSVANRFKIARIIRTSDWTRSRVPPLAKPGLNIKEGDYILKVNGQAVTADRSIYSYFQGLSGRQVILSVNEIPNLNGAREVIVEPVGREFAMRFYSWAEQNRRLIDSLSGGEIGYIYFPDTYTSSAREFARQYYSQTNKKGLVIDARYNGGGLGPEIFLHRLAERPLAYWSRRYSHDQISPYYVSDAHMVCLTDKHAGSGGDEFPYQFRLRGMGPVVGTRTWGGLTGISAYMYLLDGGVVTVPDYRIYDDAGKWVIENEGVTPDIVIELHPAEMQRGYDAQLHKAIELLKNKIKTEPRQWPRHEPYPSEK